MEDCMMDEKLKVIEALRQAAQAGDTHAQVVLGTMLASGEGDLQDSEEALSWLRRAADLGDATAMFNLGIIYEKGLGTSQDTGEAALWFWQAAEQGDTGAKIKLGTMLIKGQDFSRGSPVVQAIEASAERGHPYAQSFLARLHLDGIGVNQDDLTAEKWFRLAAEQGDESAIFNLGEMMVEGHTMETSEDEIAHWFFGLGRTCLLTGDLVKAFDCLVSIKRLNPGHFLAQRLEDEIEKVNQEWMRRD
jgi:TPR repeat protein